MNAEEQRVFSGALDAESAYDLDDVLSIASDLSRYKLVAGVTSDKELGGWLARFRLHTGFSHRHHPLRPARSGH